VFFFFFSFIRVWGGQMLKVGTIGQADAMHIYRKKSIKTRILERQQISDQGCRDPKNNSKQKERH